MAIPRPTAFWMSGFRCDWDWYANPAPFDLRILLNMKNALADGLSLPVADADACALVKMAMIKCGPRTLMSDL